MTVVSVCIKPDARDNLLIKYSAQAGKSCANYYNCSII